MPLPILRSVSAMLVLAVVALASADALCALPCAESAPQHRGEAAAANHCSSRADVVAGQVVVSSDPSCGLQHGDTGPAAEAATGRSLHMFAPVAGSHVDVALRGDPALTRAALPPISGGPPLLGIPLRI